MKQQQQFQAWLQGQGVTQKNAIAKNIDNSEKIVLILSLLA